MIRPIRPFRPSIEHQPRQQRRRRHRCVVRPRELGIRQQRVEQPPRQIVAFDVARLSHRRNQRIDDLGLPRPRIAEDVEDVRGEIEDRNVVDPRADHPPNVPQPLGRGMSLRHGGHFRMHLGEAVLEGQRIEQHQAGDPQRRGALLLLVRLRDQRRHSLGGAGVPPDLPRRRLGRPAHRPRRRGHAVDALDRQRQRPQVVRQLVRGAAAHLLGMLDPAAAGMQVPLQVPGLGQRPAHVISRAQRLRVEHSDPADRGRIGRDPSLQLLVERRFRALPLAFEQRELIARQPLDQQVRCIPALAPLRLRPQPPLLQQLPQQHIRHLLPHPPARRSLAHPPSVAHAARGSAHRGRHPRAAAEGAADHCFCCCGRRQALLGGEAEDRLRRVEYAFGVLLRLLRGPAFDLDGDRD